MKNNMTKIVFPAIAAISMVGSAHATLTTVLGPDGTASLIDTAVTANQVVQLPVGGTIYQGAVTAAIAQVTINIQSTTQNSAGSCLFMVNDSFGSSAAAGTPSAIVAANGDCSKVDLYFYQKGSAAAATSSNIYVKGTFRNLYFYSPITPAIKLAFYSDSAVSNAIQVSTAFPTKLLAYAPVTSVPGVTYLKDANNLNQINALIQAACPKISPVNVTQIASALTPLFTVQ